MKELNQTSSRRIGGRSWVIRKWAAVAIALRLFAVPLHAQFVYVANFGTVKKPGNVSAYSIGANGALTAVPGSPFATGSRPASVAVDPTGKFVYVANSAGNYVSAYSIDAKGALTAVPGSAFTTGLAPASVAVDPTGKFVYVADSVGNYVSAYSIGANGALTPVPGSPFDAESSPNSVAEPNSVAVDPTGKFVYVANLAPPGLSAYSIGANGALTAVPGSPFATELIPSAVAITR